MDFHVDRVVCYWTVKFKLARYKRCSLRIPLHSYPSIVDCEQELKTALDQLNDDTGHSKWDSKVDIVVKALSKLLAKRIRRSSRSGKTKKQSLTSSFPTWDVSSRKRHKRKVHRSANYAARLKEIRSLSFFFLTSIAARRENIFCGLLSLVAVCFVTKTLANLMRLAFVLDADDYKAAHCEISLYCTPQVSQPDSSSKAFFSLQPKSLKINRNLLVVTLLLNSLAYSLARGW